MMLYVFKLETVSIPGAIVVALLNQLCAWTSILVGVPYTNVIVAVLLI